METRDRLIEVLTASMDKQYEKRRLITPQHTADDLLANGVIVPPCKVGDTVYKIGTYPWSSECGECEHFMPGGFGDPCECLKTDDGRKAPECRTIVEYKVKLRDILNAIGWGDFGKTVFLTKEEAEKALKEREGNG